MEYVRKFANQARSCDKQFVTADFLVFARDWGF